MSSHNFRSDLRHRLLSHEQIFSSLAMGCVATLLPVPVIRYFLNMLNAAARLAMRRSPAVQLLGRRTYYQWAPSFSFVNSWTDNETLRAWVLDRMRLFHVRYSTCFDSYHSPPVFTFATEARRRRNTLPILWSKQEQLFKSILS